jgi:phage shock protein PspC (stress-responsive transcriptional regulator)
MNRRLYRSANDRIISGVAGGVAEYFEVDPVLVRILWFISVPVTGGLTFLAYIVMMIAVPVEPEEWPQPSPWAPGGNPTGFEGSFAAPSAPASGPTSEGTGSENQAGAADTATPGTTTGAIPGSSSGAAPFSTQPAATDWRSQRRQERWQRRQERWQHRADQWDRRGEGRGVGAIAFGLLLIILGGAFAWNQIDPRFNLGLVWPIAIMAVGAILILSAMGRARHD